MQKQMIVPDEIQAKVDSFMQSARARFGHGEFFMVEDGQGGNQGGSQGGSQGGDQGGDGSGGGGDNGQQGGGGSILDQEAESGQQGGDQGAGGQGGENQGGGAADTQAIVDQVVAALEGRFDSIADRRVNAILREVRNQQGQGGQGGNGDQGGSGGDSGGGQGGGGQGSTGPAAGEVREARLAYREYVGDQIRFLSDVEREHAMTLAQGLLQTRLAGGDDPETAGREVARSVAKNVRDLRKHYEDRIMAALRRGGVIPAEGGPNGQPLQSGQQQPGEASGFKAGQATAQRLLADRMPQQQS